MNDSTPCPCGSGQTYPACCGQYIEGKAIPETAEQLMRSRYTAYTKGDSGWLSSTWHPSTRPADLSPDGRMRWIGLKILATDTGGARDRQGTVEFVARYKIAGRALRLHEHSRFERVDGRWFYVDGNLDP
jgi:SEC-C motif domain protein